METKENRNLRAPYLAPRIEVIEVESEGSVMTVSGPDYGGGSGPYPTKSSSANRSGNAASSELEDMINDILTIEK